MSDLISKGVNTAETDDDLHSFTGCELDTSEVLGVA